MTLIQLCALIFLITAPAALYWLGYRAGKDVGHKQGNFCGKAMNKRAVLALQANLASLRSQHQSLSLSYSNLQNSQKFGEEEYQHLLAIAEKLKLAADTFRAIKAAQSYVQVTLALHRRALEMASKLEPVSKEKAA